MLAFRLMDYLNFQDWSITGVDIGVLIGYFIIMMAVGVICSRSSADVSDYIRMGCKSTWWLMGLSIFMQAISAGTFTGNCGQAYLSGWSVLFIGLGGVFGLLCQAMFFAPLMRRTRAITPADAVRQRFGPVAEQFFTYIGAFGGTFWGGVMLLGLSTFISATFNIPIITVIVFVGIVIVFYSVSGGSWSVQITDTLQSFIMLPICLVVAFLSLKAVGGIDGLLEGIKAKGLSDDFKILMESDHKYVLDPAIAKVKKGYFTIPWIIASFTYSFILSANMVNCHRYLSTKSDSDARRAALLAAVLLVIGSFIWYIPAIAGRVLYEDEINSLGAKTELVAIADSEAAQAQAADASETSQNNPVAKPKVGSIKNPADGAYATVARKVLPPGLVGLIIIAMFAATMSSMDSALTGTAGLITNNIYPPMMRLFGFVPHEGKVLLRITQVVNLLLGVWAITMALMLNNMTGNNSIYDISLKIIMLVSVPTVLAFAPSFFVKKLPSWAPLVGMAFGFAMSANFMFIGKLSGAFPEIQWLADWSGWCKNLLWHHKMYINCTVTLIPTLLTRLYWHTTADSYRQQVDIFFQQLATPVDFKKEVGTSVDHSLLTTVGGLGLAIAGCLLILLAFSEDRAGVYSVLFISGFIGLISLAMFITGRKQRAAETAEGDLLHTHAHDALKQSE